MLPQQQVCHDVLLIHTIIGSSSIWSSSAWWKAYSFILVSFGQFGSIFPSNSKRPSNSLRNKKNCFAFLQWFHLNHHIMTLISIQKAYLIGAWFIDWNETKQLTSTYLDISSFCINMWMLHYLILTKGKLNNSTSCGIRIVYFL